MDRLKGKVAIVAGAGSDPALIGQDHTLLG